MVNELLLVKDLKEKVTLAIFYCLVLCPFIFLIFKGNFLIDDWGQLSNGTSFVTQVDAWESLWAYRPVSWVALPLAVNVFRDNFALLTAFHLILYFFSVFQITAWNRINLNIVQRRILAMLLLSPFFASTFIISPVNQLSASLSFFFFGLGLLVEKRWSFRREANPTVYFCFLLSLLSYEISLPLIITHYLYTVLAKPRKLWKITSLPLVLILLIFWQKVIAVYFFNSDLSRLETVGVMQFVSFVFTYVVSIPLVLILSFSSFHIPVLAILFFVVFVYWRENISASGLRQERQVLIVLFLGFLSSGLLFLFSGRYSSIEGYENRGLTSSWILFSIILVSALSYRKNWLSFMLILVVATNYLLFLGKIDDSVRASDARRNVIGEIQAQRAFIRPATSTLILDAPCILPGSRSRTEVFCTAWDARGALEHQGLKFESVFLTEAALPFYLNGLKGDSKTQVLFFNEQFQLVRVAALSSELKRDLIRQAERKATELNAKSEDCKSKISQLFKLRFFGSIDEYLQCGRNPIS